MAPLEFAQSLSDVQLAKLLQVATLMLIPVGLVMLLLLYKVITLLQHGLDFVNIARFDLIPLLQDARHITSHVSSLTQKVDSGVTTVQNTISKASPLLNKTKTGAKAVGYNIISSLFDKVDAMLAEKSNTKATPSIKGSMVKDSGIKHNTATTLK
jgi:hypothetical protein